MPGPRVDNKTGNPGHPDTYKAPSCASCQRKNVECDSKRPYPGCLKYGADRRAKGVRSSARRKESPSNSALYLRVRQYEHLLRDHGINPGGEGTGPADDLSGDDDPAGRPEYVKSPLCYALYLLY